MTYLILSITFFLLAVCLFIGDMVKIQAIKRRLERQRKEQAEYDEILKARHRGLETMAQELRQMEAELEEREYQLKRKSRKSK